MEETQATGEGLTFEKVWATIQETALRLRELGAETDRRIAKTDQQLAETDRQLRELGAKTDRQLAETALQLHELGEKADRRIAKTDRQLAETDRQLRELGTKTDRQLAETSREVKKLSKNIGGINNSFGKWAEEIISAKLWKKFKTLGYTFTRGGPQKYWQGTRTVCEVDALLENGEYVMAVEIKSVLSQHDVDEHLERLERVRKEMNKRKDHRKLVGAVAGMVVEEKTRRYAQDKGLYVLVQSGNSVEVAGAKETFQAREW